MKVAVILGTRPEIIKMAPVLKELERVGIDTVFIYSGQHYSFEMSEIFFKELDLRKPDYDLEIKSVPNRQGEHTGRMMIEFDEILIKEKPDLVLVHGDTNTTLAGALSAAKLKIKLGHVEAGLRSFDRTMPEELNRIIADTLSDILFAPTETARMNLLKEHVLGTVHVTGNTIVDVLKNFKSENEHMLNYMSLEKGKFILLTAHRQENVDSRERLEGIMKGMELIHKKIGMTIVFPIHPRSIKMISVFGLDIPEGVKLIDPIGYNDFLVLEKNAALILTDSGGVQEEACILGVPCVTLRDNTERPETINVSNVLAGTKPENILFSAEKMLNKRNWKHPFGDGTAAKKIVDVISK